MNTSKVLMAVVMIIVLGTSLSSTALAAAMPGTSKYSNEASANPSYIVDVDQHEKVNANSTDVYNKVFAKGESVIVYVSGDGDTDLDLYVYDENGNLIDSDTDSTDSCVCTFTPKWTGRFSIKIKNLGSVYNRYHLRVIQ